jgi:transcriptional regulator with XRE-family HTH domain
MSSFEGLGKALRWIRDKQGKKQYEVADDAGVTKAMLSAYETGKQKPSIETLEKILGALKVDLADLFNALQIVNERTPLVRFDQRGGRGATDPYFADADLDIYQALGLQGRMEPLQEEAMTEMLVGFHKLLRYLHSRGGT